MCFFRAISRSKSFHLFPQGLKKRGLHRDRNFLDHSLELQTKLCPKPFCSCTGPRHICRGVILDSPSYPPSGSPRSFQNKLFVRSLNRNSPVKSFYLCASPVLFRPCGKIETFATAHGPGKIICFPVVYPIVSVPKPVLHLVLPGLN